MSVTKKIVHSEVVKIDAIWCDNCPAEIPRVFDDMPENIVQGKDMLHVTLSGGYDELMDGTGTVHLCKDCAQKLREAFPLFGEVIDNSFIGEWAWNDIRRKQI